MRWSPEGGFTTGTPWLEGSDDAVGFSAAEQVLDDDSVYSWHKALIGLRRANPALTRGSLRWLRPGLKGYLAYVREAAGAAFLVECNASPRQRRRPRVAGAWEPVLGGRAETMAPWESSVSRRLR